MNKWRFERVKEVLRDYQDADNYIAKIEREIRMPHREEDVNADIKGSRLDNDQMFSTMWTIESDESIRQLKRNKSIVDELLAECGHDTETIIRELYIKRFPTYTMQGLVDNEIIYCSTRTAFSLRSKFFAEMDRQLDIVA